MSETTAILLIACQDQKGLVARISGFINEYGGNILDSDHHTDRETGDFLMRTVFDLSGFQLARDDIADRNMIIAWLMCCNAIDGVNWRLRFLPSFPITKRLPGGPIFFISPFIIFL
jgi:predicted amino acid-binding ACT domain protein